MSDTNGFSTQEEIDAAFERLRNAHDAQSAGPAFQQLTKALGNAGLLPRASRSKGRIVEPLPTYEFKNGAVATVHRIGQMTIAHIAASAQKKFAPIPVPTFDVDDLKNQPNPADPAYQQAVAERAGKVNLAVMDALLELAVDIPIDTAALDKLKATMELLGMPLDEISDKVSYIKHCCITDGGELGTLGSLIRGELEEAAEANMATFSDHVPGPAAESLEPAAVGRPVHAHV